jgi:putative ABC transport system permease protein
LKFLPYILKHLRHNWVRTGSTVAAMSVCIFLFCTLQTILDAVQWGLKASNASRLVTRNAISLVYNMPVAYKERIKQVPGVKQVASSQWFGGFLGGGEPDFKKFFPNFAVDAEEYLEIYPEYILRPDEKAAFLADRRGCILGPETAAKFGWKVGDTFQLTSMIFKGAPFDFVVRGIYEVDPIRYPGTSGQVMLFHWKYFDEAAKAALGGSRIGTFNVSVDDADKAGVVSKSIDALFKNSESQTKTETEAAFRASFVSMSGNLALLLNGIALAVIFTILLVTANTMSMAVRERRNEIGVLKTLGFGSRLVMLLILTESLVLGLLGGGAGLLLGSFMIRILPKLPGIGDVVAQFPQLGLSPTVTALAFGIALFIGLAAGFVPALLAYRSKITESLRTV